MPFPGTAGLQLFQTLPQSCLAHQIFWMRPNTVCIVFEERRSQRVNQSINQSNVLLFLLPKFASAVYPKGFLQKRDPSLCKYRLQQHDRDQQCIER